MEENIDLALLITIAGMGLVFGAILLLWGSVIVLLKLTGHSSSDFVNETADQDLKRQAAAAAVSMALAQKAGNEPQEFPLPPTALVSAWQAVMRSHMLRKRGPLR